MKHCALSTLLLWLLFLPHLGTGQGAIGSFTSNMQSYPGYFNFHYDEISGNVYLEVDKLDQEFLYFSSLASGVIAGVERGRAASSIAKFTRVGRKVFFVQPNTDYRAVTDNTDEVTAVSNAFASSVLMSFIPVATEGETVLINLTPFLLRDCQNIAVALARASETHFGDPSPYRVDTSRSAVFLEKTKNFPANTEFESTLTFVRMQPAIKTQGLAPDPNSVTLQVHQSFVELPDDRYRPRKFDPRSGMNMFSYLDYAAPLDEPLVKRFSVRHRLMKKNPRAAVSEPVKPITFYVDRGAPEPLRTALIEGASWWKEAFDAAGFRNGFEVKLLPAGADPMDIRYNMINWINRSGKPRDYSYGHTYVDPRTGEIIKGVVTLGSDRHRQDYLIAEGLLQPYKSGKPVSGKMQELALARLRQLAAHEVGHTLGFAHNFSASNKNRSSVMDYPFPLVSLRPDGSIDLSDAYAKGIGTWDIRAVIWGYSEFLPGADENASLEKIMTTTLREGFLFIPDVGGNAHPESHIWDNGADPVAYLGDLMKVRARILSSFSADAIPHGAPMATIEDVLVPMYLLHRYQLEAVAKSIGGLYFTHALKGDGQVVTRMVDPDIQLRALEALLGTLSSEALALPENLIAMIPPRPSGYPSTNEIFKRRTGPSFDPLAAAETVAFTTVSLLLDAERAARLVEHHARDDRQPAFLAISRRLISHTWKAAPESGYRGELQNMVNQLVLRCFLQLAADTRASASVRGHALLMIEELKDWMIVRTASAEAPEKSNLLFALAEIDKFVKDPKAFEPLPSFNMPPGAPIGMPCIEWKTD